MKKKLICVLLAAVLAFCLAACGGEEPASVATNAASATEVISAPATEPVIEVSTEPATIPTEPPVLQHSGLREDGSFDAGTWFIGDSMTCILVDDYLKPNGLIGDANYTGKYGAHITAFFDGTRMSYSSGNRCAFNPQYEEVEYSKVAQILGEDATAIYMMWGTNFTWNAYADAYIEIVDYLLETCPNASIHLQLIPISYSELVFCDVVNGWIREAYQHYQDAGESRVFLIDTYTAIGANHDEGGIHLNDQGNENWYNAIVEHAKTNHLGQ